MALTEKALCALSEGDLRALIDNKYGESRVIDYKQALPGETDSERKEFLADVTSLANTAGGHLIYGMKEEGGIPIELCGLGVTDVDKVIARLENILRDGVQPRLQVEIRGISLTNGTVAVVIRVPRSWAAPHQITFQRDSRFYGRNSNGKYRLDAGELRVAFGLAEATVERIRLLRLDRLNRINSGETPVPLGEGAKLILHLVPFATFSMATVIDVASAHKLIHRLRYEGVCDERMNFDGPVIFGPSNTQAVFYRQIFRSGVIEWVDLTHLASMTGERVLASDFEEGILREVPKLLAAQRELGLEPPVACLLTLVGVRGYRIEFDVVNRMKRWQKAPIIDRDTLPVPEVLIESFEVDLGRVLKPLFDPVWNAAGFSGSVNYGSSGERTK